MARDRDDRDDRDEDDDDRPRRRPRRDEEYEPEVRLTPRETSPGSTKFAGIIWIITGSLQLLGTGGSTLLSFAGPGGGPPAAIVCGMLFGLFVGAVFLMVGIQTLNGSAKGTLANGIGSIIFAALVGGAGGYLLVLALAAAALGAPGATLVMAIGVLYLLVSAALLVAGIMAIVGKTEYLRWRMYLKQQSGGGRRRDRDDDDDEDDRPRRRRTDD